MREQLLHALQTEIEPDGAIQGTVVASDHVELDLAGPEGFAIPEEIRSYSGWLYTSVMNMMLYGNYSWLVDSGYEIGYTAEEGSASRSEGWAQHTGFLSAPIPVTLCPEHAQKIARSIRRDRWRERLFGPARYWLWIQRARLGNWLVSLGEKILGGDPE